MTSVYSLYLLVNGLTAPSSGIFSIGWVRARYMAPGWRRLQQPICLPRRCRTCGSFMPRSHTHRNFGLRPGHGAILQPDARWSASASDRDLDRFRRPGSGRAADRACGSVPAAAPWLARFLSDTRARAALPGAVVLLLPWKRYAEGHPEYHRLRRSGTRDEQDWTVRAAMKTRSFWAWPGYSR